MNDPSSKGFLGFNWKSVLVHDVPSSVVVFLVALPLCLGIAIACGLPPAAGLVTGIVGGVIVGMISGSPLQVSGPAAGLIVLAAGIVKEHGENAIIALGLAVLIAGVIQIAAGILRLGMWFRAVSPAVIEGMLAGIGVLILAGQFHIMVDDQSRSSGIANIIALPEAIYKGIVPQGDRNHHLAAGIGVATLVSLIAWRLIFGKRKQDSTTKKSKLFRILQSVPAPLVAVLVGTIIAQASRFEIQYVRLPDNLIGALHFPNSTSLELLQTASIWKMGAIVALIASAETLLCATAVDGMHNGPRTKYDKELIAQGVGNTICGLCGALPMTGVIVRSATNVNAGAKSRVSAILHGLWLLLFVSLFPSLLRMIPTAALAAILVYTGYTLVVKTHEIKKIWKSGRFEFAIYATTMIGIVTFDLLTGVIVGFVLSAVKLLWTFTHLEIRLVEELEKKRTTMHLIGAATFVRLPYLLEKLSCVQPDTELVVNIDHATFFDNACREELNRWETLHKSQGGRVIIDWEQIDARSKSVSRSDGNGNSVNGTKSNLKITHPVNEIETA